MDNGSQVMTMAVEINYLGEKWKLEVAEIDKNKVLA